MCPVDERLAQPENTNNNSSSFMIDRDDGTYRTVKKAPLPTLNSVDSTDPLEVHSLNWYIYSRSTKRLQSIKIATDVFSVYGSK